MSPLRIVPAALVALAAAASHAQFDGPAPLAWRWQAFSRTLSGGTPLVAGDRIYTALGNRIYCIDRLSGNQIWRFPNTDPIDGNFRTTPLIVDGILVAAADNKTVYGVDPQSGVSKWIYTAPLPISGSPVAVGNSIAFQMQGNTLQGVNVATGEASYSAPLLPKDKIAGQIAGYGTALIYFTQNSELVSLNFNDQRQIWRKKFTQLPPTPQPIIVGETLYTYSGQFLVALLASTGTARWQSRLPERPFSSPVIGAGGIMSLTETGKAYFFNDLGDLKNTKPVEIGFQPIVAGSAVGNKFIVPTSNGALNLIDPAKNTLDWSFIIRPASEAEALASDTTSGGQPGFGGPSGIGGGPRGGQGNGQGGGQGSVTRNGQAPERVITVQAAAPVALAGTTLLVPARDGSLLAFDREIGVDLTAPNVRLVFPTPGDDISGQSPLEFIFKIDDEASGLRLPSLKLEIDGAAYDTEFTKEGYLVARISSSATSKNRPLANGRRTLIVTAIDWMGNETKKSFTLNIDNSLRPLVRPNANPNPADGPGKGGGGGLGGLGGGGQ